MRRNPSSISSTLSLDHHQTTGSYLPGKLSTQASISAVVTLTPFCTLSSVSGLGYVKKDDAGELVIFGEDGERKVGHRFAEMETCVVGGCHSDIWVFVRLVFKSISRDSSLRGLRYRLRSSQDTRAKFREKESRSIRHFLLRMVRREKRRAITNRFQLSPYFRRQIVNNRPLVQHLLCSLHRLALAQTLPVLTCKLIFPPRSPLLPKSFFAIIRMHTDMNHDHRSRHA